MLNEKEIWQQQWLVLVTHDHDEECVLILMIYRKRNAKGTTSSTIHQQMLLNAFLICTSSFRISHIIITLQYLPSYEGER